MIRSPRVPKTSGQHNGIRKRSERLDTRVGLCRKPVFPGRTTEEFPVHGSPSSVTGPPLVVNTLSGIVGDLAT